MTVKMTTTRTLRNGLALNLCALTLASAVACSVVSTAHADSLLAPVRTLGSPWADPLRTRPPILALGELLPGETLARPCVMEAGNTDVSTSLTLALAIDLAMCHNPQLQGAWAAIEVQAAALGEARATYLPTLSANLNRLDDRTRYPGLAVPASDLHSATVFGSLSWRLIDFGGRDAGHRTATDLLAAALASHDATLQKTLAGVIGAYFDVQTAQAAVQARLTNEELARHTLATAQHREGRGAGSQTDTLQAATALARVSLERSRAQGAWRKAISVLVYALGMPAATPVTLAVETDAEAEVEGTEPADALHQDLEAWLEQAQAHHPAIAAARAQLEAVRDKVVVTQSEGLPTLDLTGNLYRNGRPQQGLSALSTHETLVGLSLNIPLFDGFGRTYKVRGAQAQVVQQLATLRDTEDQVLMEVVKAHADALSALDNLGASRTLLGAAQAALASVQRKFDRGASDILEILGTQTALADAQQERLRCMAEWRSARLRLLANAGILGRQDIAMSSPLISSPLVLTDPPFFLSSAHDSPP